MAVQPVPQGYHTVTPYLTVPNVQRLLDFLQAAFGGEVIERMADASGSILHAEVRIGDSVVMMGGARAESPAYPAMLYLYLPDADAAYRRALAAGGVPLQEPTTQFYGDRTAAVRDPEGNRWWMATHVEDVSREEMERRMREVAR